MKTLTTTIISLISLLTINTNAKATNTTSTPENSNTAILTGTVLTVETKDNNVVINWSSKNESGNSRFEIERSFYSNKFNTIATLQMPFTNGATVGNYRVSDNASELTGRTIAYYRVKQVNANGNISYSNVMVANLNIQENTTALVKKNTTISFTAEQNGNAVISIKSITGQIAATNNIVISKGNNTVTLQNLEGLTKGIYVSEVAVNGIVVDNQKIIVE